MNAINTRSGWLMLAVFLAALDDAAITLPPSAGMHAAEWVEFVLALAAVVCAVLAYFAKGPSA